MRNTIAYCGPAAIPETFWTRWNFDPLLIAMLIVLAIAVARGRAQNVRAGWGAIALMSLIFVSPLCAFSSALFFGTGISSRAAYCGRGAAFSFSVSVATPRVSAFGGARCHTRGHSMVVACARTVHMGPCHCTGLLAYADFHSWKCMASLARDLRSDDAIRCGSRCVGRDDRSNGPAGRFDSFCAAAAVPGAFCKYGGLGIKPAR